MKKLILIAAITISSSLSIAQNLLLMNPSFEGQSQAHIMPAPWIPCFDGGSPDTQPGQWGVNLQASHGNTYAAFLLEPNSTYQEGASIQLTSCLYASVEYTLSVDLAFAPVFNTAEPGSCYGSFAIWGGTGGCGKNELLAYTGPIYDTTWNTYTFNFTPTQDWCYISIGPILSDTCTGYINCLVDNIHNFNPVNEPDFTTINGKVYFDANNNCSYNQQDDYPMQYKLVELQPNNRYALTDNNGDYTLQVLANFNGAVNVNCDFNMPTFDITCPDTAGYTITLNGVLDSLTGYDFSSSSSLGPCTHLGITSYATAHRPIASATRYVYITNNSTIPVTNAVVTIEYADTLVWPENINIPAPFTWTLNNNILSVNLPTLMYGQNVQFSYNEEVNDFAQIGMQTTVNLSITPQNTCNVASLGGLNDTYTDITPIVNSYDPNDKQAVPPGQGDNNEVLKTDDIEYIIRFQNLGTDTAFIVKVIDTLSTYFDITTLNIGGATHPFNLELLNNNVLVYTFNNILLPPASVNEEGSIGMFSYKIAQKQSNQVPYQLNNTAHIYFDLNPAVVTNTYTHNVVDVLAVNEDIQVLKTRLYPNPAGNAITITIPGIKNQTASIHLYNASGQLVKAITNIKQQENTIDIANFATGLYYYTVTTVNGFGSGKFAKD